MAETKKAAQTATTTKGPPPGFKLMHGLSGHGDAGWKPYYFRFYGRHYQSLGFRKY
jgi:hypothetical protein